jgi:excisionase family DNA binding protein
LKIVKANKALANLYADPLLPIAEAQRLLGIKNRSTLTRQIQAGKLSAVRIGNVFKIRSSELLKLIEGRNPCQDVAQSVPTKPDRS